jgi:hypothetical protein
MSDQHSVHPSEQSHVEPTTRTRAKAKIAVQSSPSSGFCVGHFGRSGMRSLRCLRRKCFPCRRSLMVAHHRRAQQGSRMARSATRRGSSLEERASTDEQESTEPLQR